MFDIVEKVFPEDDNSAININIYMSTGFLKETSFFFISVKYQSHTNVLYDLTPQRISKIHQVRVETSTFIM